MSARTLRHLEVGNRCAWMQSQSTAACSRTGLGEQEEPFPPKHALQLAPLEPALRIYLQPTTQGGHLSYP